MKGSSCTETRVVDQLTTASNDSFVRNTVSCITLNQESNETISERMTKMISQLVEKYNAKENKDSLTQMLISVLRTKNVDL